MKPIQLFIVFICLAILSSCNFESELLNREISFNLKWKFHRGDLQNAHLPEFNDGDWRKVDLPHDYSIEDLPEKIGKKQIGPFSEESEGGASTGHVVGGTAWYRKQFSLEKNDEGKIIKILFDGVHMNADVWINGIHLGNHPYGYTAFAFDLTDYLNPVGEMNVLAVQVKNEGTNSRWYSGSGIYREVKLIKANPVFIDLWGNYITTPEVDSGKAIVHIETTCINSIDRDTEIILITRIIDREGEVVASNKQRIGIQNRNQETIQRAVEIRNPMLWSDDNPVLYSAEIEIIQNKKVVDRCVESFGIRSISFSAESGFLLNGQPVLLKGACLHHDLGILGSAAFRQAEYRKVKIMKTNGFNAIRTAHNPPSTHFLDACDELGMLVIDESFDHWQRPKNDNDYHLYFDDWWEHDMESMLLRDRNHPSVIIWSFGNEINERADSSGLAIARKMIDKIHTLDPTRPATQAICKFWDHPGREWEETAPAFALLDIHGYNYEWERYEEDHNSYPERIMYGSESIPAEVFEYWDKVEKLAYVIGDFVWTGMDYLGESGIGRSVYKDSESEEWMFLPPWPWFNAWCGDIDLLGNKKPQSFKRDVVWRNSDLEIAVHEPVPEGMHEHHSYWGWPKEYQSWNWKGHEGENLQVNVYSRCEQVRLELNGEIIGTKSLSDSTSLTTHFNVHYQPGELIAIGLIKGKEVARRSLKTTGEPTQIKIIPEQEGLLAQNDELAYFNIEVLDENGQLVPNAEVPISFTISGDGNLQAVGNGNPTDMKSFHQPEVNTFRGRCQLIVRFGPGANEIRVEAISPGLMSGIGQIRIQY